MSTERAENRAATGNPHSRGIFPWQLRLFLATTLAGGSVSAVEIAQRFSASTPTIEAHEIDCLGGVAVNDARPGTVVEIIDQKTNKLVTRVTIDGSRKGSGRWPSGQRSNNETGPQSNQHNLGILARVAGLPDTPKEVPCNNSTWNIRVPETIGTLSTPVAASTPERTVITPTAAVTPGSETPRPVATATPVAPSVSPAQGGYNLSDGIKNVTDGVSAIVNGVDGMTKALQGQHEMKDAVGKVDSLIKQVTELTGSQHKLQEQLAQSQQASENSSKLGMFGLGAGVLGLGAAAFMWLRRRRQPQEPDRPAPEPRPEGEGQPLVPVGGGEGRPAGGGPAHDDAQGNAH